MADNELRERFDSLVAGCQILQRENKDLKTKFYETTKKNAELQIEILKLRNSEEIANAQILTMQRLVSKKDKEIEKLKRIEYAYHLQYGK